MSRWRPALRVARRTALRDRGRTALVAALVAAPVLGTVFLDTAYRTAELPLPARVERAMGAADASLTVTPYASIEMTGTAYAVTGDAPERAGPAPDPLALLPAGSRVVPSVPASTVGFAVADRTTLAQAREIDAGDPVTAGLFALRSGRPATAAGEVTLSPSLADRLGARVGDEVHPVRAPAARVVGLAALPDCRSCEVAVGLPGWTGTAPVTTTEYLVDLPTGPVDARALQQRLAGAGLSLVPREARLHPELWAEPDQGVPQDTTTLAVIVLVAGIGMLEVVLLAGTAFAVAARRQVRDSALVLANGGRPADVRRMLLAQGAVLGVVGAVAGVGLGVLAVLAAWRPLERLVDADFAGLVVSPRDVALAAAVGAVSGVAAAVVPAWGASRVPVVAALAGRFGRPARGRRQVAAAAAGVAVLGLAAAGLVAWRWAESRRGGPSGSLAYPLGMVAGFGTTMVALTVLAPSLVGLAGRVAGRLPLTGRLALRDAARHRHRTGPAVGAVMVAVAGSVAVAFAVAATDQRDRDAYEPHLPYGWASVYLTNGPGTGSAGPELAAVRSAATELPAAEVVPVPSAVEPAAGSREAGSTQFVPTRTDGSCADSWGTVAVGADAARLVAGSRAAEAAAALAAGRAVVTDPCLLRPDGTALLQVDGGYDPADPGAPGPSRQVALPAVLLPALPGGALPRGVLAAAVAAREGLVPEVTHVVVRTTRAPTADEEDRARSVLGDVQAGLDVERGYGAPYLPGFVALMGGAGLVTLAGVAISVALSAAEGRADLATLAAIGAPPRRRRGLAMAQAGLVAGLGVGLGLLLGAAMGVTVMSALDGYPLVVPWPTVLVVGVGVPALGVLAVGVLTRSRLPMVRRLG